MLQQQVWSNSSEGGDEAGSIELLMESNEEKVVLDLAVEKVCGQLRVASKQQ